MESVDFHIPFDQFKKWYKRADKTEPEYANAMAVATVSEKGIPSIRMVLLKSWDQDEFVFYTNFGSRKGKELLATKEASLLFHWKSQRRQIRIEGAVKQVSDEEADAYFATRPRGAQIGAWASKQSREMEDRHTLKKEVAKYTAKFAGKKIPRPEYWSGFRVKPRQFEFWQNRRFRLHERELYTLEKKGTWKKVYLFP